MPLISQIEDFLVFAVTILSILLYQITNPKYFRNVAYILFIESVGLVLFYIFADKYPDGSFVRIIYVCMMSLQLPFYCILFNSRFKFNNISHYFYLLSGIIYILYFCYNLFSDLSNVNLASNAFLAFSFIMLVLHLQYFYRLYASHEIIYLKSEPLFWMATGGLFFFASNIFATGLFHRLVANHSDFAQALYTLNFLFGILQTMLIGVSLVLAFKENT